MGQRDRSLGADTIGIDGMCEVWFHPQWCVMALAWLGMSSAWSQDWSPTRPIKRVVPIVGSTSDTIERLIASRLQEAVEQTRAVPGCGPVRTIVLIDSRECHDSHHP